MPLDLSIPATATIALIVEDPITRDYLREAWGSPIEIAFVLGGGNDGVRSIVRSFEEEGFPNVFGVTDRDFRPSNHPEWRNPAKTFRTFVLPVHEVENYLLDAPALQASAYHNRGLDVGPIERRMSTKASGLCWWAACRESIAVLKLRFREPFIPDPTQAITDELSARAHICGSEWFNKLAGGAAQATVADVHALLSANHTAATERLADGSWRKEFAGKEILRDVAGWICDRPQIARFPPRDVDFYSDLAKGIASWQVVNGAVPAELTELLAALRARIAQPPPST
jgi:hypothetical protein